MKYKTPDWLEEFREIIRRETEGMTREQELEYWRVKTDEMLRRKAEATGTGKVRKAS